MVSSSSTIAVSRSYRRRGNRCEGSGSSRPRSKAIMASSRARIRARNGGVIWAIARLLSLGHHAFLPTRILPPQLTGKPPWRQLRQPHRPKPSCHAVCWTGYLYRVGAHTLVGFLIIRTCVDQLPVWLTYAGLSEVK